MTDEIIWHMYHLPTEHEMNRQIEILYMDSWQKGDPYVTVEFTCDGINKLFTKVWITYILLINCTKHKNLQSFFLHNVSNYKWGVLGFSLIINCKIQVNFWLQNVKMSCFIYIMFVYEYAFAIYLLQAVAIFDWKFIGS